MVSYLTKATGGFKGFFCYIFSIFKEFVFVCVYMIAICLSISHLLSLFLSLCL